MSPYLSNWLAAIRVNPEWSRLDGFLWVYLGDSPLHLIYQGPARYRQHRSSQTWTKRPNERLYMCVCLASIPPHLMSCPWRAPSARVPRSHSSRYVLARTHSTRCALLILHLTQGAVEIVIDPLLSIKDSTLTSKPTSTCQIVDCHQCTKTGFRNILWKYMLCKCSRERFKIKHQQFKVEDLRV